MSDQQTDDIDELIGDRSIVINERIATTTVAGTDEVYVEDAIATTGATGVN